MNPQTFRPHPNQPKDYNLVFCADGFWRNAPRWAADELKRDEPDMLALRTAVADSQRTQRRILIAQFPAPLAASAERTIERLAKMQLQQRDRPMLQRVFDLSSQSRDAGEPARLMLQEPELYAAVVRQIRGIEWFERAFIFTHLSHHFRCLLFGNADFSNLGCNVKTLGNIEYNAQSEVYSRAPIGLSVMRWEDEAGFHLKPFEITASGAACVAQNRRGTDQLFKEGEEIARFTTPAEARQTIRHLLDHPNELAAMSEAGRARTLRDHTWANWATDMLAPIQQWQTAHPARAAA